MVFSPSSLASLLDVVSFLFSSYLGSHVGETFEHSFICDLKQTPWSSGPCSLFIRSCVMGKLSQSNLVRVRHSRALSMRCSPNHFGFQTFHSCSASSPLSQLLNYICCSWAGLVIYRTDQYSNTWRHMRPSEPSIVSPGFVLSAASNNLSACIAHVFWCLSTSFPLYHPISNS